MKKTSILQTQDFVQIDPVKALFQVKSLGQRLIPVLAELLAFIAKPDRQTRAFTAIALLLLLKLNPPATVGGTGRGHHFSSGNSRSDRPSFIATSVKLAPGRSGSSTVPEKATKARIPV